MKKTILFLSTAMSIHSLGASHDFKVNVDYLYWIANQSEMNYGISIDNLETFGVQQALIQPNRWNSGVRLEVGYESCCNWDALFSWTHFQNSLKGRTDAEFIIATQLLSPAIGIVVGGSGVGGGPATIRWKFNFDMFDLDAGFTLYDNAICTIHPFIGIKGLIVNQSEHIGYQNFFEIGSGGPQINVNATTKQVNNFWGIGPRAGFNTAYKLGYGFNILGDFSISALYGRLPSTASTRFVNTEVINSSFILNKNRLIPTFELFLGLEWGMVLKDRFPISFAVGYETQYYWNLWRTQNSTIQNFYINNAGSGDLMMNGLTVRASFGF